MRDHEEIKFYIYSSIYFVEISADHQFDQNICIASFVIRFVNESQLLSQVLLRCLTNKLMKRKIFLTKKMNEVYLN